MLDSLNDVGAGRVVACPGMSGLTPWLTGAGARSAEGTDIGHENAEGMAYVGVRVEPPVRQRMGSDRLFH